MNRLLLLIVPLILICCSGKQIKTDNFNFKQLVEKDISDLTKTLTDLDTIKKENDWVEGDKQFYKLWLDGANYELNGDFKTAIKYYKKALNITRYEMSTYEINLPLGRALIQNSEIEKAELALKEFKNSAENELNNDDSEWGLTKECKLSLKKDLELCNKLLSILNAKN
jgi:tetratricopeptide (TPR) repeat protein